MYNSISENRFISRIFKFDVRENTWVSFIFVTIIYTFLSAQVIGANPFAGETSAPMGLLSHYDGWKTHKFKYRSCHPERSDILDSWLPDWISLKQSIRANGQALWNSVTLRPGITDVSRSAFTPSFLIFLLIKDNWLGFYFAGLFKLVIAALGTFLLLRLFVGFTASILGGAVYAYSGFNAAWYYWPQVNTSAWIPWLLWACCGWYIFRNRKWLSFIVISTIMLILGGFPAVAAYGFYAAMLSSIFTYINYSKQFKFKIYLVCCALAAISIGFFITAIPLLGLLDVLKQINLGYRQGGTAFKSFKELALIFNPHLDGLPRVEKTFFTGHVAFLLSIYSIIIFFLNNSSRKIRLLIIFSLTLFVLSLSIAFGVWPHKFIKLLPAIGKNPWSRLIVITDLSIAMLFAVAWNHLVEVTIAIQKRKFRFIIIFLLSMIAFYQLHDQIQLFREFNGLSSKRDFFPTTPAINYVKSKLIGFQSVVADNSYLISGTLCAYGIPEWFAHGFKTNSEKKILNKIVTNPFRTPTAATFSADQIMFNHNIFSKLDIKYVLINSNFKQIIRIQPSGKNIAAPPMPLNSLEQIISINDPISVTSVGIVLATYHEKQAPSDVSLLIKDKNGITIADTILSASSVHDNRLAVFKFKNEIKLNRGYYKLIIELVNKMTDGRLTAWYSRITKNKGDCILINGKKKQGSILYTLFGKKQVYFKKKDWHVIRHLEPNILLVENKRTPIGAYFIRNLSSSANWNESGIQTNKSSAEHVIVNYTLHKKGYIVLPVRFFSGWVVYKDGKKYRPQRYLGCLLATKVKGPTQIVFSYEPDYLKLGFLIMLSGVVSFILVLRLPIFNLFTNH